MSPTWSIIQSAAQIVGAVVTVSVVIVLARGHTRACKRSQDWFRKALANLHAAQTWESFAHNCIGLIEDDATRQRLLEAHKIMGEAMDEECDRVVAKAEQNAGLN